eukprot:NODE_25087_length_600_cov_2.196617.p1 GENE.NODE_25087_length_600_cov_2.196617~~NODE_25087_length_600_cov_2.196617.p1  ORF type:complete len:133 (+),score=30.58 NODE_25087_length_600_cov_2.196617:59-400(+)
MVVCYARFARCRAAGVSLWARQVNQQLDAGRRCLGAVALPRICAEARPAATFPEQLTATPGATAALQGVGETALESDPMVAALIEAALTSLDIVDGQEVFLYSTTLQTTLKEH